MTARLLLVPKIVYIFSVWGKRGVLSALIAFPIVAGARPSDLGTFATTSSPAAGTIASGTYTTNIGATGQFRITAGSTTGYNGRSVTAGQNQKGIEILNNENFGTLNNDEDKFTYTLSIVPDDVGAVHNILISQSSYQSGGNSEIARQKLEYTQNPNRTSIPATATVVQNPPVPFYYNAMGDYFMGKKLSATTLSAQNALSEPQLRIDNSATKNLFYYNILSLSGSGNSSTYTPTLNRDKQVSLNSNNGTLPPNPTIDNIIKSTTDGNSFAPLLANSTIANGGTYVSYGIENSNSDYLIEVRNASAVTLTYEGIMKGNIAVSAQVIGETFNEWINFGVSSEPNYIFTGTVFNDNGGIASNSSNQQDTSVKFTGNNNYFNGVFDGNETGIFNSALQVRLTDCKGSLIKTASSTPNPRTVSNVAASLGKYSFSVLPKDLESKTDLCIEEIEPSNWIYSVDTTPNIRRIAFAAATYNYANLDFGEVEAGNTALVLKKYQYVHQCNDTLNYSSVINNAAKPTDGFSMNPAGDVKPGNCIAYKIEANNRGHVDLADIQISDVLQNAAVKSIFHLPRPSGYPAEVFQITNTTAAIGENGTVISNKFNLLKSTTPNSPTIKSLYFNSKYGNAQSR